MKASVNTRYGPPEVLEIKDLPKPIPAKGEVLIKMMATTVNRTDCGFRNPEYLLVRLISGLWKPRRTVLGSEVSGIVEAVGADAKLFKPGDEVFGLSTFLFGTHAEYLCIPENKAITLKPKNISFHEAAAICDGAFLAWANLKKFDLSKIKTILINGASGSIGTAAVQLAKQAGVHVTAVCNSASMSIVKSLGADVLIDYTKEDFTSCGQRFDLVLDAVGKSSFFKCRKILKPKAVYISSELGYMAQNIFLPLITLLSPGKKVMFPIPRDTKEDMEFFRSLVEAGKYRAVIDRTYSLDQIVEATHYVEQGEKIGNVVIDIHAA